MRLVSGGLRDEASASNFWRFFCEEALQVCTLLHPLCFLFEFRRLRILCSEVSHSILCISPLVHSVS